MDHMSASVRDLRYRFPEIEARLRRGEEIELTSRGRLVGRLIPARGGAAAPLPDFLDRLRRVYRTAPAPGGAGRSSGKLLEENRGRY